MSDTTLDQTLTDQALADIVTRCDDILSHAWMVRTFVKHSEEVEDYPELEGLMDVVRTVFDICRAQETRAGDPRGYLHMLRKKFGHLRKAVAAFERDAVKASTHTNFMMAIRSINVCVRDLDEQLQLAAALAPPPAPARMTLPRPAEPHTGP